MRQYELVLVVRPTVGEADRKKLLTTIKSWIKTAKVAEEHDLGSKALAYPIKKELTGFYYDYILETETAIDDDLEKRIIHNDNILRHLVIRKK